VLWLGEELGARIFAKVAGPASLVITWRTPMAQHSTKVRGTTAGPLFTMVIDVK
jgi:hypothetical protein